jgi:hypothetical protein
MTVRDRIVLMAAATFVVLAAAWLLVVSPERQRAAKLAGEVSSAQAALNSAESELSSANAAEKRYQADYAAIVSLGKAVPADRQVPSLIYDLAKASGQKHVEFASITSSAPTGGASASSAGASSAASATEEAGFEQMPFTFIFNGGFDGLYNLFTQLDGFAKPTSAGDLLVSGRLLTVQSVSLAPVTSSGSGTGSTAERLAGTITATAYVLPAGETLTDGATPAGPTGTATPAATAGAPATSNTPAVIKVNP